MRQVEDDPLEREYQQHAHSERGAYTFFALLCFLVAIALLSVFLNRALDGFSNMLLLLGVIASGCGGIYLLERRPAAQKAVDDEDEHISPSTTNQLDEDNGAFVEGSIMESSLVSDDYEDEEDEDYAEFDEDDEYESDERENAEGGYYGDESEDVEEDEEDEQSLNAFKLLVEDALRSVPLEFQARMENLAILVEPEPGREVLKRVGSKEGYTLLGLYEGTPLIAQTYGATMLPERITIYQHTIEAYCHYDPERIRDQVRATLLHEIAHHFGIDHDEMPIWVK